MGACPKEYNRIGPEIVFPHKSGLADMVGRMASESRDSQFYFSCGGFELSSFLGKHHRQGCKNFQSPTQPLAQHSPKKDKTELAQQLSFLTNPDLADMVGRMVSDSRDSKFCNSFGGAGTVQRPGSRSKRHRQGCMNFQSPTQSRSQHTPRSDTLQGILVATAVHPVSHG